MLFFVHFCILQDAATKKGVGPKDDACDSESLEKDAPNKHNLKEHLIKITPSEAQKIAESFSKVLSQCQSSKHALQTCNSDEECNKAFMGMTVCAGQFMCPLQHTTFLKSLDDYDTAEDGKEEGEEMAEAKINIALDVLGECVSNYDKRAAVAKRQYPKVFDEALKR